MHKTRKRVFGCVGKAVALSSFRMDSSTLDYEFDERIFINSQSDELMTIRIRFAQLNILFYISFFLLDVIFVDLALAASFRLV